MIATTKEQFDKRETTLAVTTGIQGHRSFLWSLTMRKDTITALRWHESFRAWLAMQESKWRAASSEQASLLDIETQSHDNSSTIGCRNALRQEILKASHSWISKSRNFRQSGPEFDARHEACDGFYLGTVPKILLMNYDDGHSILQAMTIVVIREVQNG